MCTEKCENVELLLEFVNYSKLEVKLPRKEI